MTGETVAVKQIRLGHIPKAELGEIMAEIDLLKNLKHPNIVKYKGSEKTKEYLYIILEYCENGSLQHICKRFGKFPEGLVGVYISQVLEGLIYLHDQGVIHRDIKGANILTNKDGSVKLADFGVATKAESLTHKSAVVGSPYWMAPEVIDQSGATTASDIWSVGCVVIELLEGKPPYHFLDPMPALFRIVQDDCPPLPEGASPVRTIAAERLLATTCSPRFLLLLYLSLFQQIVKDFLTHCFQKEANVRISARNLSKHPWMASARRQMQQMHSGGSMRGATAHAEAVKSVQEWNEALKGPAKPSPSSRHSQALPTTAIRHTPLSREVRQGDRYGKVSTLQARTDQPSKPDNLALPCSTGPTVAHSELINVLNPGLHQPLIDGQQRLNRMKSSVSLDRDCWDDDFELAAHSSADSGRFQVEVKDVEEDDFATIRPRMQGKQDKAKTDPDKSGNKEESRVVQTAQQSKSTLSCSQSSAHRAQDDSKNTKRLLVDYADNDSDDDFSDLVAQSDCKGSLQLAPHLRARVCEELSLDPFGEIDDDNSLASVDMDANVARDRHARMCAHTVQLIEQLKASTPEDDLIDTCDELELILTEQPDMKTQVLAAHGALTVLQLLEVMQIRDVISRLLGLLNVVIFEDAQAQENLCLIGAIPVVMPFCSKVFPHHVRIEAAHFIFSMCSSSTLTLQFVLSCRGLKTLVGLIDEDYNQQKDLVWLGVACVNSVLELQSRASRNDFCRMLAVEGLLDPLSTALLCVLDDRVEDGEYSSSAKNHILQTLLIYASSEPWLKEQLAARHVLRSEWPFTTKPCEKHTLISHLNFFLQSFCKPVES